MTDSKDAEDPSERTAIFARMNANRSRILAALEGAGLSCSVLAGALKEAYVKVELSETDVHAKTRLLEPTASAALGTCLAAELAKATLPKGPFPDSYPIVERVTLGPKPEAH